MKNKAIKILIVSFVFISYLLSIKSIFAYAEPYSYEIDGMHVYVNYGSGYQQEDNNSRIEDEDDNYREDNNYNNGNKVDNRNYENPLINNTKTPSTPSSTSSNNNSKDGNSVINNYYSLFSSFGSKTSTDNSTSSSSSDKVATNSRTVSSKDAKTSNKVVSSDSKSVNDSKYDSRYGGAIDTTGSRLSGSAYGSNFTPNTFWGWFISIILILAIIIVVRIIMRPKEKEIKQEIR